MANLSSFFPVAAAGGGGGFTKMNKYSTARSLDDATHKLVSPATSFTVNPATDLGLSDGDSLGYMLVGAGVRADVYNSGNGHGGNGGRILLGTSIISNASTDLVLTPAAASTSIGTHVHSTISGGLTLTSGDGSDSTGDGAGLYNSAASTNGGQGINGYGFGGSNGRGLGGNPGQSYHGFGGGSSNGATNGGDGAILLFY